MILLPSFFYLFFPKERRIPEKFDIKYHKKEMFTHKK